MKSSIAHNIKHREKPNDEFYTPIALAKNCIDLVPLRKGHRVLDIAYGDGSFFNNFPNKVSKFFTLDFFNQTRKFDWVITNPPYSKLDDWFKYTIKLSDKGFGLLLGWNNLTARRIEMANNAGFGLTKILIFKVFKWFGMSCFVVFEKGKDNIIKIDRKVWR